MTPGMMDTVTTAPLPIVVPSSVPVPPVGTTGLSEPRVTEGSAPAGEAAASTENERWNFTAGQWQVTFGSTLGRNREKFEMIFGSLSRVEAVDYFGFDLATNTVTLELSISESDAALASDVAWEAVILLGLLWNPEAAMWDASVWDGPDAQVVVSGATYRCATEVMRNIGSFLISQSEWERRCRVS